VRTRLLEVAGPVAVLRVRTADLGEALLDVTTLDPSATVTLIDGARGSELGVLPTGVPGTVGAEIRLNAKVTWTLRLAGGSAEQNIDLRGGSVAGVELTGGTTRAALQLPPPRGTVPVKVSGTIGELTVGAAAPVRFRVTGGAGTAVLNSKTKRQVKAGSTLTSAGWRAAARGRYDVTSAGAVTSIVAITIR
jgi:hypothetical protein